MFAKVAFLSCVAFVSAQYAAPIAAPVAAPGSGYSQQSRSQDDAGNYAFSYDIVNEYGAANGRQESGDSYGNKQGSYVIQDIDGRSRRVDYVADELGFRATINTNEPGTAPSEPASALYNSPAGAVVAAPSFAAPARVLAPAPVAVAAPQFVQRVVQAPAPVAVAAPQFVQRLVAPAPVAVAAPQFAAPQFAQPIFQRQVIARAPIAVAPAQPVFAQRFVQQAPFVTQTGPIPVGPSRLVQAAPARIQVSQRLTAEPVFAQAPVAVAQPVFAARAVAAPVLRAAPVFAQAAPVAVASPFAFNHNIVHAGPVIRKA